MAKAQLSQHAEEEDTERAAERATERAAEIATAERAAAEEMGEYINEVSFI